jgi:hypothetical protein
MLPPRCSVCVFGTHAAPDAAVSYAFALCHGTSSVASVFKTENETAQAQALSGVSSYCSECRCITWLTRHADLQDGLLQVRSDRARWQAMHAALGV